MANNIIDKTKQKRCYYEIEKVATISKQRSGEWQSRFSQRKSSVQ